MAYITGLTRRGVLVMFLASLGAILFVSSISMESVSLIVSSDLLTMLQGFDNGWWGTILGSSFFLCYYGHSTTIGGVGGCNLSTPEVSAGSGVQSGGISKFTNQSLLVKEEGTMLNFR